MPKLKIKFNRKSDIPIYQQFASQVSAMVREGKLKAGDVLPGEITLAEQVGCGRSTVRNAYRELERLGIVTPATAGGRTIADKSKKAKKAGR